MADNRLQMIAELIDKVSPTAKKMEQAFKGLQTAAAKDLPAAFKKYQNAVNANETALKNYGKRHEGVRRELRAFQETILRVSPTVGRLTESIGAFSTGSGAAVSAAGAMGAALIVAGKFAADFATKMRDIKFGSEESGLGTRELTQVTLALGELSITAPETAANLVQLKQDMDDATKNAGEFMDSIKESAFKEFGYQFVELAKSGKDTFEVLDKLYDQLDEIKRRAGGGSSGMEKAGRYLSELHLDPRMARYTAKEFRERLDYIRKHGSTEAEMREAEKQAKLFRDELFKGEVIIGRIGTVVKTEITQKFLFINDLLDRIDAKYNAWIGGGAPPSGGGGGPFAGTGALSGAAGQATFGGGAASTGGGGSGAATFNERFSGAAGGGGRGPTFRSGVGPGRTGRPGAGAPGGGGDPRGLEGYIRQKATENGIDPDTAVAVARSEGLSNPIGDHGTSHGAFQLHTGGGLGDAFRKETGLDPADPANEKATIDFALKNAAKGGWGPWHGAANTGIGPWAGIGGRPGVPRTAAAAPTGDPAAVMPGAGTAVGGGPPAAFIMHHTGGRGTVEGVQATLRQRGLGVEYVMDRAGNIVHTGGPGSANILPGYGPVGKVLTTATLSVWRLSRGTTPT